MNFYFDKTILDLITILLAGGGIFAEFTKYSVPQLNMAFFGHNPYGIKRGVIDNVLTYLFTGLVILGLFVQAVSIIYSPLITERIYSIRFYSLFFLVGLPFTFFLIFLFAKFGRWIAKRKWLPKIIQSQGQAFDDSLFIFDHNWWRKDQLEIKDKLDNPEKYITANKETVEERINQIENLLEIKRVGNIEERINVLKPYFENRNKE